MKKRLLAAVLCLVMLISCVPSFAFQAQASQLPVITCNGSAQSAVSFPRNERITLTAEGGAWYQWQIKVNDSLWVNISGETGATLDVSYAMIANLCQGDTAYLRVVADGERNSDPVAVTATEAVIKEAAAPAAASYVLKAAPRVVVSDPSTDSSTGSSAADSANTEAVAQARAALTAAEAAANEAAETAAAAKEDAAAKEAAYNEAQNEAVAAKAVMDASAVTTEIPAETSAEEFDENGNHVVVKPAETVVTYASDLQAAYAAAQAEADGALQTYQAAEAALADAEANLEAAQAAVETAAAELEAAQSSQTELTRSASSYDLEPTLTKYVVEIRYIFGDGTVAAPTWAGTYSEGSAVSVKDVPSPAVLGYTPDQQSVSINLDSINENVTHYVTYSPALVDYEVLHYQQNVDNDNYTLVATVSGQELTGTEVSYANNKDELIKSYDGFYVLPFETVTIAADGSTKIEIKYDRLYYLMNFDLDGGYGVEPIYARYGAPVSVGKPTKAGYSFVGWSSDGTNVVDLPGTMPAENRTYKAIWQADATAKVTIAFWGENADDEKYSYLDYSAVVYMEPSKEFTYSPNNSLICALKEHDHSGSCYDISILTCTKEEHTHSESCYTCNQTEHTTHTAACYDGVGNAFSANIVTRVNGNATNGSIGELQRWIIDWQNTGEKYIYINGTWYEYSGTTAIGGVAPTICHKHSSSCYKDTEHTHSVEDGCYKLTCPETAHRHTSDCYMNGAGLDSNKWKFVRSDTVTVAANGSTVVNVYYDRVEYSVQFYKRGNNPSEYTDLKITAKWGANILNQWPTYNGSSSWYVSTSGSKWQNSIQIMPVGGAKFYGPKTGSNSITAYYYVQVLPGEEGTVVYNGVTYKLHHTDTSSSTGTVTSEDKYDIQGYTYKEGTNNGSSYNNAKFYYTRNAYDIKFFNPTDLIKTVDEVPYEMSLGSYDFVPGDEWIPKQYEPGSMRFAGWYLNPECTGEQYVLSEHTMPLGAENHEAALSLYAKWVPVTHTVKFYLDKNALDDEKELSTHPAMTVTHGNLAVPTPSDPENGEYNFVAWFYLDENGVEKAFDFAHMPVTKDMNVYGKWSSDELVPYYIYYKLEDGTEIAAPTTGDALAGNTKTFYAKGGDELYPAYKEGFFPKTTSHSITMDINGNNAYTFVYVEMEAVPYTVKYLEKDTGEELLPSKTVEDNRMAVVTETYVKITGYLPDAYQKRLEVGLKADGTPDTENNVIIFYYTADTEHAYWTATHYTENLDKDAQGNTVWTEYQFSESVGNINEEYGVDPIDIPGFTYDSTVSGTLTNGTLTSAGLDLKLYYTRNSYPYEVRYLEEGTGKQLAEPKKTVDENKVEGRYGQSVSEDAIAIPGYTAKAPTTQSLNIKIETGDVVQQNIITFYYTENQATINYEVVGPEGCGSVTPTSETLKVLSDTAQGSTATATSNSYKFVGWYSDELCTEGNKLSTDAKYTPTKADGTAWVDGTTYYAKFEYDLTTLTITKSGAADANDGFIFDVVGSDGTRFTVSVKGEGSVTIAGVKVGTTYTITERGDWAWRYTVPGEIKIALVADGNKNAVTVGNRDGKQYLLDGSAYARNNSVLSNTAE